MTPTFLFDTPPRHGQYIIYGTPIYTINQGLSEVSMPRAGYWDDEQKLICSHNFKILVPDNSLNRGTCVPPVYTIDDETRPYCWQPVFKSASAVNFLIQTWVENEDKTDNNKLEDAAGFEAHYDELKAYREKHEQQQQVNYLQKLYAKSEELGIGSTLQAGPNLQLAEYVMKLEAQLAKLTQRIEALEQ